MIRFLKNLFSKGSCEQCGWLVACPECSESMRIADTRLKNIERSRVLRKEPRHRHVGRSFTETDNGTVDKESFAEVLQQVLIEVQEDQGRSLMLSITCEDTFSGTDTKKWDQLRSAVTRRIVSQVRHEDFVTLIDDRTYALLLVDSGEEPLSPDTVVQRFEEELSHPYQTAGRSVHIPVTVRRITLNSSTSLEDIVRQMDS